MQRLATVFVFCFALLFAHSAFAKEFRAQQTKAKLVFAQGSESKTPQPTDEKLKDTGAKPKGEEKPKEKDDSQAKADSSDSESSDDKSDDTVKEASDDKSADEKESPKKSSPAKKDEKKKPKPYEVERDELTIEVELSGIFVADEMEEVVLRPEVWTRFKVLEAVEHGSTVKKGDVLVRFDAEKLEDKLAEEAIDQRVSELSLMQDEEEFPRVKRLLELSHEAAQRKNEQTKADYEYYHSVDRPITVQIAHYRFKSAQEEFNSAEEELDQLQKMYEADELTEETEEIVLRRQRFEVETAKLILELQEETREYTLNVILPRLDERYETELEESELAYKQAKTALEIGTTRKSFDMEKKRKSRAKSVELHAKLLNDKQLMELRAPADGVVYYGSCVNGKWSQVASLKTKLKPYGTASPNSVLMTIVKPGSLHIASTVSEKELPQIEAAMSATIVPTADKEQDWEGEVTRVGTIPEASNKFPVKLEFENSDAPEWLVAGMTCKAKVLTYENGDALMVPLALVQTDEDDDETKYVMLVKPDEDEPVRQKVKLGRKKGKSVEVLDGVEEGDKIVKEEKKDENGEDED